MPLKVEKITEELLKLGEGPHWDVSSQSLYYTDILNKNIHKFVPATKKHTKAHVGKNVSIIIPIQGKQDEFVISCDRSLVQIRWDGVAEIEFLKELYEVEEGTKHVFNDGKCDPSGRLWVGTMGNSADSFPIPEKQGTLYSFQNGQMKSHFSEIGIANGIAVSADLKKFYYIDSNSGYIEQFDFDIRNNLLENRLAIFTLKNHGIKGILDGMTIDSEGNLWAAVFEASKVIKVDPRKPETLLQVIDLPTKQITSVAFGGPNLDELYVTSANIFFGENHIRTPYDGGVFRITGINAKGLPANNVVL